MVYTIGIKPNTEENGNHAKKEETYWNRQISSAKTTNIINGVGAAIALLALGGLAANAYLIRQSNIISKTSSDLAYRPYVGPIGVEVGFYSAESRIRNEYTPRPRPESIGISFAVKVKNFGPVPATQFSMKIKPSVDNVVFPALGVPDSPSTLYPGQIAEEEAIAGTANYADIEEGRKSLDVEVRVEYTGPTGNDKDCQKFHYDPATHQFSILGPRCVQ